MGSVPKAHVIKGQKFVDILKEVRSSSDFKWAFWDNRNFPAPHGAKMRTPAEIREQVLKSERVVKAIQQCKEALNWSESAADLEAKQILTQMAHDFSLNTVRMVGYPASKVFQNIFTAIYTNKEQIENLKELSKKYPIVFMPTHKTYMDFLLITYICFHCHLTLPAIAAGMDFLSMNTVGQILRKCGAFFIRRSFGQDQLYWAIFTEYVQTHLRHCDRPVYDIVLVPISINYGRVLEETLYPYELLGFPKPAESTSGLVKARAILDENFGDIFVNFCNPISVREYFNGNIDRSLHALEPDSQFKLGTGEKRAVVQMAHEIIKVQQENLVVTILPLICSQMNKILTEQDSIEYGDLCDRVEKVVHLIERLGERVVFHCPSILEDIRYHLIIHDNIFHVDWDGNPRVVRLNEVKNKAAIGNGGYLGALTSQIIDRAVPRLVLGNYANMAMHILIKQAYIALCLDRYGPISKKDLVRNFEFLRSIFGREFIVKPGEEEGDFESALNSLRGANSVVLHANDVVECANDYDVNSLAVLLQPYVLGYWVVCDVIRACNKSQLTPDNDKWLISLAQNRIVHIFNHESLTYRYNILSTDLIKNAFHALVDLNIVVKINHNHFNVNVSELLKVQEKLDSFLEVVPPRMPVGSKL